MESRRAGPGCLIALAVLIVGVLIGASGMTAFFGLGLSEILARAGGRAQPVLVVATPTVPVQIVGGAAAGRRMVLRSPIALDSDTSEPDLLVVSRNYDRDSDTIMLYSPDAGAIRWESAPLGGNGYSWQIAFSPQMIVVVDQAQMIGLSRADGAKIWEAPLTDELAYNICRDCLQTFGDAVVALTSDGVLQAFSISRGNPLWSARLHEATRQLVRVGDLVGVPDSLVKGDSEAGLFVYNPQDGSLERTIEPTCAGEVGSYEDRPHYYDPILVDPQSGALYWMLDSAYCLFRTGTGPLGGEQRIVNQKFRSFSEDRDLIADGALYLSTGEQIYLVDGQGAVRLLLEDEDYDLQPLEARGDVLLALARRTRGSSRLELWAVGVGSGERRWTRVLEANDPIVGSFDGGNFAVHITGNAVALIQQLDDPEHFQFELLDLENGTSRVNVPVQEADPGNDLRGIAWGNRMAWAAIDELYGVSLEDGQTLTRWP